MAPPITQVVLIKRTQAVNRPPTGLQPGELCVEMADPCRLWVGVPPHLDPLSRKLLFDSSALGTTLANYYTKTESDGRFVNIDGDTMTGYLTLSASPVQPMHAATKQYVDSAMPSTGNYVLKTGDTMTGALQINSTLGVSGSATFGSASISTTLTVYGGSVTSGLTNNGVLDNYGTLNIHGDGWVANNLNVSGRADVYAALNAHQSCYVDGFLQITKSSGGPHYSAVGWAYGLGNDAYYTCPWETNPNWGTINAMGVYMISAGAAMSRFNIGTTVFDFRNNGKGYCIGGGVWLSISDERVKNVLGNYQSGLEAIAALRPVRYTYKGNDTMDRPSNYQLGKEPAADTVERTAAEAETVAAPYMNSFNYTAAVAETEYIGLVAQEAEVTMPELVLKEGGFIDGQAVTDVRTMDSTPLIFALVNAVKELKTINEALTARVAALEGTR